MINRLKTHEFHFVLNNALKTKLYITSKKLNLSFSKTVLYIIEKTIPIAKKIHLMNRKDNNKVENVNWDSHLKVYFPDKAKIFYNILKSIHKDNNTHSIAGILRYLLKIFIRGVDLFGFENFLMVLKNGKRRLERKFKRQKLWYKIKVRQLSIKRHLIIQYDINYNPIFIRLLN